jgi:hypothetical protein
MTGGSTATFKMVLLYSLMISTILFHRVSSFLEVTLRAVNMTVHSDAVGNIDLHVTGKLDVKASGIGEVNYYGNPKIVTKQAKGIGKINQR